MKHSLPADASPEARRTFDAIVDVHESEGVYVDVTTSNWPQLVIVQGYGPAYQGAITYAIEEDGTLSVTRLHGRDDSASGYVRAIRRQVAGMPLPGEPGEPGESYDYRRGYEAAKAEYADKIGSVERVVVVHGTDGEEYSRDTFGGVTLLFQENDTVLKVYDVDRDDDIEAQFQAERA